MILLPQQFQALVYHFFSGWVFALTWSGMNRLTWHYRRHFVRWVIETLYFFRIIEVGIKYPTRNRIRLDEYKILRLRRNHTGDVQLILVSHREYQKLGYNILSFFSFVGQPKLRSS